MQNKKRNIAIFVVIFLIGSCIANVLGKKIAQNSARRAYDAYISDGQQRYEEIVSKNDDTTNIFTNNVPYFTLNLPIGMDLTKIVDNDGIVAYKGETDEIMCQLTIMDSYTLMNLKSQNKERKVLDYNQYQKSSMDVAYSGLVESTIKNSPYGDVINVEHSVNKINNVIFVYIKYDIPIEEGSITRDSYNFLRNGYTVTVIGFYPTNDEKLRTIIENYLRSIKFE